MNNKTYITLFVTKNNKFRVKINDTINPPYEVTINGQEWGKGKGTEYKEDIKKQMKSLISSLETEYQQLTGIKMNDKINEKANIHRLEMLHLDLSKTRSKDTVAMRFLKQIIDDLKLKYFEEQSKWIPVSRPRASNTRYWTLTDCNEVDDAYWTGLEWLDRSDYTPIVDTITHFQEYEYPEPLTTNQNE